MLSFNLLCFVVYIALCDVYVCIAICIHLTSVLTSWRQRSGSQEGWNSVPSFLRRIIVSLPRRARSGCSSGCIMHERALPWYQPYLATRAQHPNLSYRCQWVYLFHQISRLVFSSLVYIFLAQFHKHTLYCLLEANWGKKLWRWRRIIKLLSVQSAGHHLIFPFYTSYLSNLILHILLNHWIINITLYVHSYFTYSHIET